MAAWPKIRSSQVVEAGADLLVAGNAIFGEGNAEENARKLLRTARLAAGESLPRPGKWANNSKQPENRRRPAAIARRNRLRRVK